jgi:lipoate-protein ligase A
VDPRWRVVEEWGKVADLHAGSAALLRPLDGQPAARVVRLLHPTGRAVVLGSAQPESDVNLEAARAAGTEVVRRRSGGGAVLVGPGLVTWVDVVVPAEDRLWEADVGHAFWWLGSAWVAGLADVGVPGAEMWGGGLVRSRWSGRVCYAGVGPGEVLLGGRKVVGMSQRRTRRGALFQCAVPVSWDPVDLLDLLAVTAAERSAGITELAGAAVGIGPAAAARLAAALLDRLP